MRWRGELLLLLVSLPWTWAECPANTFTCNDGSCIPSDWRGDGEKDCEDGSDETGGATNGTVVDPSDSPIFDEIVFTPSTASSAGEEETPATTTEPAEDVDCRRADQQKVDGCAEHVVSFLHDIERVPLHNASLLWHERLQSRIESGCNLTTEYTDCAQSAPESCMPDEGVRSWREVEMFVCQLLLPAAREHATCFESLRRSACVKPPSDDSSTLCRLVTSVRHDVKCIQDTHDSACNPAAIEMLAPIFEEALHVIDAIRCNSGEVPRIVDETAETSTETATSEAAEEEANKPDLAINMADAVNSLYYIYDICSSNYSASPFAAVAEKICAQQDAIAKHSECYQKTLEKQKCAVRNATTECEALTSFNNNLDCAIVTMNDECDVDAQNLVVELQENLNDLQISRSCFEEQKSEKTEATSADGDFKLNPTLPKCHEEQENAALGCLVELVEINKKISQLHNLNFLLEIASPNSTVVDGICQLFDKYEQCLNAGVFVNSQRCSFASPLNSLARIGLAPICSLDSRSLLSKHQQCLKTLAVEAKPDTNCQTGLVSISGAVSNMLQGIHGEALLCRSFYVIRDTFSCGEKAIQETCGASALNDLLLLKTKMTALGEEEGCPREKPADLDAIIARPVTRRPPTTGNTVDKAPTARKLLPPPTLAPAVPTLPSKTCNVDQQKAFEDCVRPLTAFQPHPLSVIAMPRDIDQACKAFTEFKVCSATNECHPLWAKGMGAMFEFACAEAADSFKKVRKCIRDTAAEENVRTCVADFSRGAPTHACLSSNKLLACAIPRLQTKCGKDTVEWVSAYVTRFATAIDPRCKVAGQLPVGRVVGVGCTAEEETIIDHCAAPLNDIGQRVEELFAGGMQSLIKNVNALAPVFAGGCNLTEEFKTCAQSILAGRSPCVVSSCFVEAGRTICDKPDPVKAIDDNLSCFFGQAQEPSFAKCVRTTISTVKQFTLANLKHVLPEFIDCAEDVVRDKCGDSPIQVLRAMSSPDICVLGKSTVSPAPTAQQPQRVQPKLASCDVKTKEKYETCTRAFFEKFPPSTATLFQKLAEPEICSMFDAISQCRAASRVCASTEQMAFLKTVGIACKQPRKQASCVAAAAESMKCPSVTPPTCTSINQAVRCLIPEITTKCGDDGVTETMNILDTYAKLVDASCLVELPEVAEASTETATTTSTATSACGEDALVEFLDCEAHLDQFSFRPISIIGNSSLWGEFCEMFNSTYRPCIEGLKCKFEPAASAQIQLIDAICNRPVTLREQKKFGECLSTFTNTKDGAKCTAHLANVDALAPTAPAEMCTGLDDVMRCAAKGVEQTCGFDALLHVFDLHVQWATLFNATCVLQSTEVTNNEVEPSRDTKPVVVQKDETTPPTTTLSNSIEESLDAATPTPTVVAAASSLLTLLCVASLAWLL